MWERGEIAPEEQFLLLPIIFCYLMLDVYVKTRIRFSLRDKRIFEMTQVEITRADCSLDMYPIFLYISNRVISNYWYLRVNFLPPGNLLCNVSSLRLV